MKSISSPYQVEVDSVEGTEWSSIMTRFDDATIYQTWSYGAVRWGRSHLSHVVLKRDGEILAASQARIVKVPVIGRGIAYIPSGPLWRRAGIDRGEETFRQMIRALHDEYVRKRGLLLRLLPNEWADDGSGIGLLLTEEGLERQNSSRAYRTFLLDLSHSRDALRRSLDPKWRGHLNRAERNGLTTIEGTDDGLYATFAHIYADMHGRKKFAEFVDVDEIGAVQKDLPDHLKMTILIAAHESEPVAALVSSAIGNTAVYFLGATNEKGRELRAAYWLQWDLIERLQGRGYRWYDLGGTDPEGNPGTHSFKAGLSGKTGREVYSIGQFDGCGSLTSSLVIKLGDKLKEHLVKRKIAGEKTSKGAASA